MDECFPLNGNEADPSVKGLKEMIETYRNAV